jgi:hypothetical protein
MSVESEEGRPLIQFPCPTCKSTCSVDDKFAGRKAKCPKCGARVRHIRDTQVELLTAGTMPVPAGIATATTQAAPLPALVSPPSNDPTPLATAVVPHSVTEFVRRSESKQNLLILGGLLAVFTITFCLIGVLINKPILVVSPIAIALTIMAVYLWMRKKKLEDKLRATSKKP